MVSEAKKPLVASMAFLAIYLIIILSVTTYIVIGGIKEVKEMKGTASTNVETPKKTQKDGKPVHVPGSGKAKFKKALNKLKSATFMKLPLKYSAAYKIIKEREYLEPKPETFLNIFEQDFYKGISIEEELKESKETEMVAIETVKNTTSPCRFFTLQNTFGLNGSVGYFSYYNTTATAALLTKPLDIRNFEAFIKKEKLNLLKDDVVEISGRPCRIKLVLEEPAVDSEIFSEANIKVLTDFLIKEKRSWEPEQLKILKLPSGFGLFVGLEPEVPPPPDPLIDGFERELTITNKMIRMIVNVFKEKELKAFYYGDPFISFQTENFNSIHNYAEKMTISNYNFIDGVNLIFRKINMKIHYAAKSREVLKSLILKTDSILDEINDKTLSSTSPFESNNNAELFKFIANNEFCILFVFEDIENSGFEADFKGVDQKETILLTIEYFPKKIPTWIGLSNADVYCLVNIIKYENFENHEGRTAYKFSLQCQDQNIPLTYRSFEKESYEIRIAGIHSRTKETEIMNRLIAKLDKEDELKDEWLSICNDNGNTFKEAVVIIFKK